MPKAPRTTATKLISALRRIDFFIDRQRGSHVILRHADGRKTVIPKHAGDVPIGTLKGILRDIEIPIEELLKSL